MMGRLLVLSTAMASLFAAQANSSANITSQPQLAALQTARTSVTLSGQGLIGEGGRLVRTGLIGENGKK